jgi:hypothetical protein
MTGARCDWEVAMRWAQAAGVLLFLFMLAPAVDFAHADSTVVVFAAPEDPDRVRDVEAAENVLRNLGGFQVLPEAAMKIKLQAQGAEWAKVETREQALEVAKKLKADIVVWIGGWADQRKTISVLADNLKTGARRRGAGRLFEEDGDLRDQLVKGVAAALVVGDGAAPESPTVKPPTVVAKADWGHWTRMKATPERKGASILLHLDQKGRVAKAWLLETSWPTYGQRAMEVVPRYEFGPALDGEQPAASYAIINTYCKVQSMKAVRHPGNDRIWGQVFVEEIKE